MKRLLIAGFALFALVSAATAQVTPGTPLGTTGTQPGVTGTVGGAATTPGVTGTVGGTAGVQAPGVYPGTVYPSGLWGYPSGMTSGYNPYGGMNYGTNQGYNPYGNSYYGGYSLGSNVGGYPATYQAGTPGWGSSYPVPTSGYGVGYGGSGCGCGAAIYSQPVVYSAPVSSGCCGKKKKGLFGGGLFR